MEGESSKSLSRERQKTKSMTSSTSVLPSAIDVSTFDHTPSYCEENVYYLCKKLCMIGAAETNGSDLFVVFISNEKKQIPLWHQKASARADGIILWDYHVICIQRSGEGNAPHKVWDLDSSLTFPTPLDQYVSEAIRPSFQLFPEYKRLFRVVHAPIFLRFFASDRRHMRDAVGNWISQPPTWEPIVAEDGTVHNLDEYIRVSTTDVLTNIEDDSIQSLFSQKFGLVASESQLEDLFSFIS